MEKEVRINNIFKNNKYLLFIVIAAIIILLIFLRQENEEDVDEEIIIEESTGSGFLEVETYPDNAEIFIDGVSSGTSPATIYDVDVGSHNIVIKKEGYEDSVMDVNVEAGKKSFIEVDLELIKIIQERVEIIEDFVETADEGVELETSVEETEKIPTVGTESSDKINIGNKFSFYFDFDKEEFVEKRQLESDIFSKKFNTYFVFTRFNPVNIKTIDKNIADVEKEDCEGITGQYEWLYSDQSLCIITKENIIVAMGGSWDDTENTELTYKILS